MLKYGKNKRRFNPNSLHKKNIDRQSISIIPVNSKVLEIGCATGFMGKYLKDKKGCLVYGVELGEEEGRLASKILDGVIAGDIEDESIIKKIKHFGKFDVVFASALIEHLKNPWEAIYNWKKLLKINGLLIITTSNISHWSVRLPFIFGKFEYTEYGLLDNTHLHLFTPDSFKKLVSENGFIIDQYFIDSVGGGFPKISSLLSRFFPSLFTYQMLIVAKRK